MKSIEIGKAIVNILKRNDGINGLLKGKMFPLIADNGTTFPFLLYRRSSVDPAESKDYLICSEYAYIEIMVVSDDYEQGINLVSMVEAELRGKRGIFENVNINDIKAVDSSEDYINGSSVQYLKLKITIQ